MEIGQKFLAQIPKIVKEATSVRLFCSLCQCEFSELQEHTSSLAHIMVKEKGSLNAKRPRNESTQDGPDLKNVDVVQKPDLKNVDVVQEGSNMLIETAKNGVGDSDGVPVVDLEDDSSSEDSDSSDDSSDLVVLDDIEVISDLKSSFSNGDTMVIKSNDKKEIMEKVTEGIQYHSGTLTRKETRFLERAWCCELCWHVHRIDDQSFEEHYLEEGHQIEFHHKKVAMKRDLDWRRNRKWFLSCNGCGLNTNDEEYFVSHLQSDFHKDNVVRVTQGIYNTSFEKRYFGGKPVGGCWEPPEKTESEKAGHNQNVIPTGVVSPNGKFVNPAAMFSNSVKDSKEKFPNKAFQGTTAPTTTSKPLAKASNSSVSELDFSVQTSKPNASVRKPPPVVAGPPPKATTFQVPTKRQPQHLKPSAQGLTPPSLYTKHPPFLSAPSASTFKSHTVPASTRPFKKSPETRPEPTPVPLFSNSYSTSRGNKHSETKFWSAANAGNDSSFSKKPSLLGAYSLSNRNEYGRNAFNRENLYERRARSLVDHPLQDDYCGRFSHDATITRVLDRLNPIINSASRIGMQTSRPFYPPDFLRPDPILSDEQLDRIGINSSLGESRLETGKSTPCVGSPPALMNLNIPERFRHSEVPLRGELFPSFDLASNSSMRASLDTDRGVHHKRYSSRFDLPGETPRRPAPYSRTKYSLR